MGYLPTFVLFLSLCTGPPKESECKDVGGVAYSFAIDCLWALDFARSMAAGAGLTLDERRSYCEVVVMDVAGMRPSETPESATALGEKYLQNARRARAQP